MLFRWLKKPLPRGLYGRAVLILIVPVVTIQLVVSIVFIQRHFERVTEQMTAGVVRELAFLQDRVAQAGSLAEARTRISTLAESLDLRVTLPQTGAATDRREPFDLSGRAVIDTLRGGLPGLGAVDLVSEPRLVALTLDTPFGPMAVALERRRVSATNPHQLLVLMIVTGVLMTLVAFAFLRNQVRPITLLADAAEAFGRGQHVPYRVRGATEVRAAGRAFLEMRARIERQIEQRTLMLSGVSHDLRTPITRLRLELSMLDDAPEVARMRRDLEDMGRMLDGFLEFARDGAAEEPVAAEPVALVRAVVANAHRAGQPVDLIEEPGADGGRAAVGPVTLRPDAVARALQNLIGNAVRYGTRAEVRVRRTPRALHLVVEDDGPGIPPDRRDEALRPFARLDSARNQNLGGGVGLGLAIAADVARAHGGRLDLGQSARLGGLRAEIVLPA